MNKDYFSAFVPHDLDKPLARKSDGPLAGLTCSIKDMFDIAGARTGGGSPEWLAEQRPAIENAGIVETLLDSGVTIVGKTVCDEFFYSITGENWHYGTPQNPRAIGRIPGGSSSGAASSIAFGLCDLAIGSDTGGSVRVPASFCGVYGIRPTWGRMSLHGAMPMAPTFDVPGWFAANPSVFRKGGILLQGERVKHTPRQVLTIRDTIELADPGIRELTGEVAQKLQTLLCPVEEAVLAEDGLEDWCDLFREVQAFEVWRSYGEFLQGRMHRLGPGISERMEAASQVSEQTYTSRLAELVSVRSHLRQIFQPGVIGLMPTTPCCAPQLGLSGSMAADFRARTMQFTIIGGLGGLPQINVPMTTADGFPIGISLIGWPGGDEDLLDFICAWSCSWQSAGSSAPNLVENLV